MKKLTSEEVLSLAFGTKITAVYPSVKHSDENEFYTGVVFGDKIGWEDGLVDCLRVIAEQVFNKKCNVYQI